MQLEMLNCLSEAKYKCAELSSQCVPTGSGLYQVIVSYAYYCKSTDAFAGFVRFEDRRFETMEEANTFADKFFHDDDILTETKFPKTPTVAVPSPFAIQDCPF
jgi:hypothetical protein